MNLGPIPEWVNDGASLNSFIMKYFILCFLFAGSVTAGFANTHESTCNKVDVVSADMAGPTSVIISGGQATFYDDGADCTYNSDTNRAYGPDC